MSVMKNLYIFKKFRVLEGLLFGLISIVLGVICYLVMYGRYSIYFSHVYWIYSFGRDPMQHQLGWEFFRQEPWRFPLGTIKAYGYPFGTSVTFMDSIPLFAFFFKLFSPWLGENFQYLGIWELTSIIGQILVGMLILKEFTRSYPLRILGALLLVFSPPLLYRAFFHSSLSAHWIILMGIWFVILEYRHKLKRGFWIALFGVAMLIHLYFVPMLVPLWLISMIFRYQSMRKIKPLVLEFIAVAALVLMIGYGTGIFGLTMNNLSLTGFGQYSSNLNTFFNTLGYSKFFAGLPIADYGQYEGYSYLGLGYFVTLLFSIPLFVTKDSARRNWRFIIPFFIAAVVYMAFAISNKGYFNLQPVWDIPLSAFLKRIIGLFRSSGRFIWPVFYFIVLFGIIVLIRNYRLAMPVLIIALVLQFIDMQPLFNSKKLTDFAGYGLGQLKDDFLNKAGDSNDAIMIIPTEYYEHIVEYAVRHDMTISSGYFGRGEMGEMEIYSEQIWQQLLAGKIDDRTLYFLSDKKHLVEAKEKLANRMYICKLDEYDILFSKDNGLAKTDFDFKSHCSIPAP